MMINNKEKRVILDNQLEVVIDEKDLKGPSSFSLLSGGKILVVDECGHQLKLFSESGELIKTIGSEGAGKEDFYYPTDIIVLNECIYLTDRYQHKIKAMDLNGKVLWEAGGYGDSEEKFKEPFGITAVDSTTLAVVDYGNARIKIYNTDGNLLQMFGKRGIEKGYYESQSFKTTLIYKSWARSYNRFSTIDTNFLDAGYTTGDLEYPKGIASDGTLIYICDYSGRIQVFQKDGKRIRTYGCGEEQERIFSYAQWIQLHNKKIYFSCELDDSLYTVDANDKVQVAFQCSGHFIEFFCFFGEHLYFMSPWERKLFRVNIKKDLATDTHR